jgi:hypothetical protein
MVTNACGVFSTSTVITIFTIAQCDSILRTNQDYLVQTNDIKLYPNPTTGTFIVELPESTISADVSFTIIDIYGKELLSRSIENNTNTIFQFNLTNVAKGTYLLKVTSSGITYRQPIVIW